MLLYFIVSIYLIIVSKNMDKVNLELGQKNNHKY